MSVFLAHKLPSARRVEIEELIPQTEGFSQETFLLRAALEMPEGAREARYVIKRQPAAGLLEPYDLEPEFRVLHELSEDPFPSPRTPWLERGSSVFERPFYVMEHLPGRVPIPAVGPDGQPPFSTSEGHALLPQVVSGLASIHAVDWEARGLSFLLAGRTPETVASFELDRWTQRIERSRLCVSAVVREALLWLKRNPPKTQDVTLIHGDYRLGNWLIEGTGDAIRLSGILDWEMVHLGDPHEDLAWCVSPLWYAGTGRAGALAPAEAFLEEYQRRSGRRVDPERLYWYGVLAVVKMIAIEMTGVRAFLDGRTHDLRLAIFDHQIPFLCAMLAALRGWLPVELLSAA